ncbi:MAG: hypothetical protein KAS32_17345 [Candidatus Peribacteraceae bacterium]|nr:hypothetical protein [Candidatus Peribacteraceae bacterium]
MAEIASETIYSMTGLTFAQIEVIGIALDDLNEESINETRLQLIDMIDKEINKSIEEENT